MNNKEPKADQPDKYLEYYNAIRTKHNQEYPGYRQNYLLEELKRAKVSSSMKEARSTSSYEFVERGPANVPGRTRGLIVDPADETHKTWIAGSVGGGIWKTTDAGESWELKTIDVPNLAIGWIDFCKSDPDVMYAGTGEGFGASQGFIKGNGVFKSTDRGESWVQLPFTANNEDFQTISRIIVDPNDPDVVLVSANNDPLNGDTFNSGIFKTVDGGSSWYRAYSATVSYVQQIIADPLDFNILYATERSLGVLKSTDAGETWTIKNSGMQPDLRVEIAISHTNTDILYASAQGSLSGNGSDLYVSEDAGENWYLLSNLTPSTNPDFLGGQGWYDNTIMVHPFIDTVVYTGGVDMYKFTYNRSLGTVVGDKQFQGVEQENTESFFELINFGGQYYAGRIATGDDLSNNDIVSVELRFGPGKSQKAHRYTVPQGRGSMVPDSDYQYQDYVDVPFELWDVTNNKQLMIGFRDQQRDGKFNLIPENTEPGEEDNHSREYLFFNLYDYNPDFPNSEMAQNGGQVANNMFFIWPILANGGTWDENNLPNSKFAITWEEQIKKIKFSEVVTDAYGGSKNGFSQITGQTDVSGIHPDHHNLIPIIHDESSKQWQILNANDGGVYYSNVDVDPGFNNGDWFFAGTGYSTTQFYYADKAPDELRFIGGAQDNGTWMTQPDDTSNSNSEFQRAAGGDGFGVAWNDEDPSQIIVTSQFNNIRRSTNGGQSFVPAITDLADAGEIASPFVSKIENIARQPNLVFTTGASGVWRSDNFAASWSLSAINENWSTWNFATVKISEADPNIVWAGGGMIPGSSSVHISIDNGVTFSPVNNYQEEDLGRMSGLATHPENPNEAFALFSFAKSPKILRTYDKGQTWEDISGFEGQDISSNGFPDVAVYDLQVLPSDTSVIWVGTEIGLFESLDNGLSWQRLTGMPAVSIWDLKIVDNQMVMATHGRGIWSARIDGIPARPIISNLSNDIKNNVIVDFSAPTMYDSVQVWMNGINVSSLGDNIAEGNHRITVSGNFEEGNIDIFLKAYFEDAVLDSESKDFNYFKYRDVLESYGNDFNTSNDDFFENGLGVKTQENFKSNAINSPHDYSNNTEYWTLLKHPIKIGEESSLMYYRDVALVEPGVDDSFTGTTDLKDFVTIEGSKDGLNWKALTEPYDARKNNAWLDLFNADQSATLSNYVNNSIDLSDEFSVGDTIAIRFRLFSDDEINGWGWIVDDVYIQQEPPLITGFSQYTAADVIVYPNPTSKYLKIQFNQDLNSSLTFAVYSMDGTRVISERKKVTESSAILDIGNVESGNYILKVDNGLYQFTEKIQIRN